MATIYCERVSPGLRVRGKFGPLIPNPNATPGRASRRVCDIATGVVITAVDVKTWKVKRDQDDKVVD